MVTDGVVTDIMTFQRKLRRLMAEHVPEFSAPKLAEAVGVGVGAVNGWLAGSEPGVRAGMKLANVLRVPVTWLFDDRQDFPPPSMKPQEVSDEDLERAVELLLATIRKRQQRPPRQSTEKCIETGETTDPSPDQ